MLDASADKIFENDALIPVMYCKHVILTCSLQLIVLPPRRLIRVALGVLHILEVCTGTCSNLHE